MGALYRDKKDVITKAEITQNDGKIELTFSADCGKFGSDENLAGFSLTPEKLLKVLNNFSDYSDEELL